MGAVVFVLVIVIFYSLLSEEKEVKTEDFSKKADTVAGRLFDDTSIGLINDENELNATIFLQLAQEDYEQLRAELGITGDFCVFLEAADGTLILISNMTGIGSPNFDISNCPCGTDINDC